MGQRPDAGDITDRPQPLTPAKPQIDGDASPVGFDADGLQSNVGDATEEGDDTLFLLFCCCHPDLAPASQVALTLRAVGGLTTREIADAFYVPEATMAQRISRAKRALQGRRLDQPGDLAVVLRVVYLVYTAGHRAGWTWPARQSGSPANSPSPRRNRRRAGCSR